MRLHNYNNWFDWHPSDGDAAERQRNLLRRSRINMTEHYSSRSGMSPDIIRAANPDAEIYRHYTMLVTCPWDTGANWQSPVLPALIETNDWWLRDKDRNILTENGEGMMYDLGASGVKEYFLANVLTRNALRGYDGILLDYWWPYFPTMLTGGVRPAKYPTDDDWFELAWKPFITYVCAGIHAAGYKVCGNEAGWHGRPEPWAGFQRSLCDVVVYERWAYNFDGDWLREDEITSQIESLAGDPLEVWASAAGVRSADLQYDRKARMALALYYIGLPNDPALMFRRSLNVRGDGKINWLPEWDFSIGEPSEPAMKLSPGVWSREFTQGIVLFNYSDSVAEFPIEIGYVGQNGTRPHGVVRVEPKDSMILARG